MGAAFVAHVRESDGVEQSLADHLIGVGQRAEVFAAKLRLGKAGRLAGLLHDAGKYSAQFQDYLKRCIEHRDAISNQDRDDETSGDAPRRGEVDHSSAGAQHVYRRLHKRGGFAAPLAQAVGLCIASHHSGLINCISADGEPTFARRMKKEDGLTHLQEVLGAMDESIRERVDALIDDPSLVRDFELVVKQLASSNRQPLTLNFNLGLLARFLFSCLLDADRLDTAEFEIPDRSIHKVAGSADLWTRCIDRLDERLRLLRESRSLADVRARVSDACKQAADQPKGIFTLTVPTGGGKTLASLRFALHHARQHGLDRILFVIPYTSIIDQNAREVRRVLERPDEPSIVLEHHSNLTPTQDNTRTKILSENWDAPIVFTTMVQFLETLFAGGTRGARRLHQLANSLVIFDEAQTIPAKTVHLFNNAVNFLVEQAGTSALLCTATQPPLDRVDTSRGNLKIGKRSEIIPDVSRLFKELARVDVIDRSKPGGWTEEETSLLVFDELGGSGSVLVIVNTKAAAREVHGQVERLWADRFGKPEELSPVYHLSTHMCAAHRHDVLEKVRRRLQEGLPVVCVSTALIEAGVDVDFKIVIRQVAGLDSIAQAAGRCNREGRESLGKVFLINAPDGQLRRLPEIRLASEKAKRVLSEFASNPGSLNHDLIGPMAVERYFQYLFNDAKRIEELTYPIKAGIGRDDSLLNLLASNDGSRQEPKARGEDKQFFNQSFRDAAAAFQVIDAPTSGVIVPYREGEQLIADLCASADISWQKSLLKRAQRYSINLFPHVMKELSESRAVRQVQSGTDVFYLDSSYYSQAVGLTTDASQPMSFCCI